MLAFDPSAGSSQMTQAQAASNAAPTINDLADQLGQQYAHRCARRHDRACLGADHRGRCDLDAKPRPRTAITKTITTFADAYNDLNKLMREQTKYDAASKTAGTLQGDSTAVGLMRTAAHDGWQQFGCDHRLHTLADVGLDVQTRRHAIESTPASSTMRLANLGDLKKLFASSDDDGAANDGFATMLRQLADQALGVDGAISTRQRGSAHSHRRATRSARRNWKNGFDDRKAAARRSTPHWTGSMAALSSLQSLRHASRSRSGTAAPGTEAVRRAGLRPTKCTRLRL